MRYDDNLWTYLKKFQSPAKLVLRDRLEIILRIGKAIEEIQNGDLVHLDIKLGNQQEIKPFCC
jgi:hypothetical protein